MSFIDLRCKVKVNCGKGCEIFKTVTSRSHSCLCDPSTPFNQESKYVLGRCNYSEKLRLMQVSVLCFPREALMNLIPASVILLHLSINNQNSRLIRYRYPE